MARSSYIYVVQTAVGITAAFTVKHEMLTFLRAGIKGWVKVTRVRDGDKDVSPLDITEEVFKELA